MKGRQKGRPTKWVSANIQEPVSLGRPGVTFHVWTKWKRNQSKMGVLTVTVGGLRWKRGKRRSESRSWDAVASWFRGDA